ncbi:MAG: sigma-70 family RNA polymerase sigma factor [Gemmatimonadetes bacterium]|nr:sigma-70 family RNA polymerase sigma factor [Gemmatimonadota bacterium]
MDQTEEVRRLLAGVKDGRSGDWDRLFDVVYQDLRRIARYHLRGQQTGTLGTTAIVNEAYIRLAGSDGGWEDRAHFFAVASRAMRQILVSNARRKLAQKRGGGAGAMELMDHHGSDDPQVVELLELDEALTRLGQLSERLARVVELRFFGDLSVEETAEVLGVTDRTVRRDWRKARSFLHGHLKDA